MKSFTELEMDVIRWGEARGIVQHAKPLGQAIKTMEEAVELVDAINKGDMHATKDAIGDVLVTLILNCAILDVPITECLYQAYQEIKDRKGRLGADGVFVKEQK
jgi:NTP pyrophosphatase (non-canonical NTP hydrolase)